MHPMHNKIYPIKRYIRRGKWSMTPVVLYTKYQKSMHKACTVVRD